MENKTDLEIKWANMIEGILSKYDEEETEEEEGVVECVSCGTLYNPEESEYCDYSECDECHKTYLKNKYGYGE